MAPDDFTIPDDIVCYMVTIEVDIVYNQVENEYDYEDQKGRLK